MKTTIKNIQARQTKILKDFHYRENLAPETIEASLKREESLCEWRDWLKLI